jgi:hypothetical protein
VPTVRLSDLGIQKLKRSEKHTDYFDLTLPTFGVRVAPSGTKTFILKLRSGRQAIGRYPRRSKIIELNDQLRTTFKGGRVQITRDFYELDARLRGRALWVMSRYNKFDDEGEHDRGVFIFAGYAFEWHVEYRGVDGTGISPDPSDPGKTFRVLTLYATADMLAVSPRS